MTDEKSPIDADSDRYKETKYGVLPKRVHEGIHTYIDEHVRPGSFLRAVLANDLYTAVANADPESERCLPNIAKYVVNTVPRKARDTRKRVGKWMDMRHETSEGAEE